MSYQRLKSTPSLDESPAWPREFTEEEKRRAESDFRQNGLNSVHLLLGAVFDEQMKPASPFNPTPSK